jgi:hypothetical protein
MNPITEIKSRLKKYPDLITEVRERFISVKPDTANGFEVWFSDDEHEYTVGYDGWHEHFDKTEVEEALNCFAFGLTSECRLKVKSRGGNSYKWVMEALEDGVWVACSTTALFSFSFWQKAEIKYLSNDVLKNA